MAKNLLIVESPAKAKTIERYLGKDFTVKSSYGHIRDLDKGEKGVDIKGNFEPHYSITPSKKKVVKELKDHVKKVQEVWLATDEDREGEAISWHLCKVLGLDEETTKRIVFREITKPAIEKAINSPRTLDLNLVNAQQARRVLDRLVGFELSELLWKKIRNKLSAGRVQSVAVKLVVEKEREINKFKTRPFFRVKAIFLVSGRDGKQVKLEAVLSENLKDETEALKFLNNNIDAKYKIENIEVRPAFKKPAPPFTTSTLQQEASRKLGFSVTRTMVNAQRLYEQGYITYMRTDSTNLSNTALQNIGEVIEKNYGKEYVQIRKYNKKKALAQEAHEAIRPTYAEVAEAGSDRDQKKLYSLISKRTIASQMANAKLEKTKVKIGISTDSKHKFLAEGEVLKFEGFLKVYIESTDEDDEKENKGMLPPLVRGQDLPLQQIKATQRFTRPPARYTEASLVKKLEELGIGRPSTYAPTISKIMEEARGYVSKESRPGVERKYRELTFQEGIINENTLTEITGTTTNRLYPSDMGMVVSDFLSEHFDMIMDYGFTANIEQKFDQIADGEFSWKQMINDFYGPFHQDVQDTLQISGKATGERILGTHPKSGHTVLTRMSRFGPVIQIGTKDELGAEKAKFANLSPGQSIETITLEEALDLFKLPKDLGEFAGKPVSVGAGRYGPYVKYGDEFISLSRKTDPQSIKLEEAIFLIKEKQESQKPIATYQGQPITKGKGRFGPFLKWGDSLYVNIPKRITPEDITPDQAIEMVMQKIEKEKKRFIQKWPEHKISIENGRWGPFIRSGRKFISLPKVDGKKMDSEQAAKLSLDEVKKIIESAGS